MSKISRWLGAACLAWLLVGCGGGDDKPAPIAARAGAVDITTSGGSVDAVLEGGTTVRLDVPAGALVSTTTLRIDPTSAPVGALGSFTLSPGGITLLKPVTLTVTLPAAPAPDADTVLLIDTGTRRVPASAAIDRTTQRISVYLTQLGLAPAFGRTFPTSAHAARPTALTQTGLRLVLAVATFEQQVALLQALVADLTSAGSAENATLVQTAMTTMLRDPRFDADARVRIAIASWRGVVCGQQSFSVSALNNFNGDDIPTFAQLSRDAMQWDRFAQDLGALVAQVSNPAEAGCANVPADFTQPVRDRLPAFLTAVTAALDLLDPSVDAGFDLLFQTRATELLNLASDLGAAGAVDLQDSAQHVLTGQLDRSRNVAYTACRSTRDQKLQAKLLVVVLANPVLATAASFGQADLWSDVQFCGMPLHWQVLDAQGAVLQQGDAGGIGPGLTTTATTLKVAGAAKIELSGPLAAIVCPVSSQNNEQLVFTSGPQAGPASGVQQLTPSGTNQYLQSSPLDFDVATLQSQGAEKLVVQRQGGFCSGDFPGLTAHDTIVSFTLDASTLQITTSVLPDAAQGAAYSTTLAESGGSAPYTWGATGLGLGLSLDPQTGVIGGTPSGTGTLDLGVTVDSADGTHAARRLSLAIRSRVASISAGSGGSCGITPGGGVKCWGFGASNVPVDIAGLTSGVAAVSGQASFLCALTTAGGVKCRGSNVFGQLGNGTTTNSQAPVDVVGLGSGVTSIRVSNTTACAVVAGGGLKCWGDNSAGNFGNGTTTNSRVPVDAGGLSSGVATVAVGSGNTCVITTAGGLKCWGVGNLGELGNGTQDSSSVPVDVIGLGSGVAAVSISDSDRICAVTTAGAALCWGADDSGALGFVPFNGFSATPTVVRGLESGIASIVTGNFHTCALTTSGGVLCWGESSLGRLGNGSTAPSDHVGPGGVVGLGSGVAIIAAGHEHTCASMLIGGVKCWGSNQNGALGSGTSTSSGAPVDVLNFP